MPLFYPWVGYSEKGEQIAEARLVEAARTLLGNQLPTPALLHAAVAELLRTTLNGGVFNGGGARTGYYIASDYGVPIDGVTDATATFNTLASVTVPTGGPYLVVICANETLYFANDYTIPANCRLWSMGGKIKPASGKTVTFLHEPQTSAGLLDPSLGGTLAMGGAHTSRTEFFAADPAGVADFSTGRTQWMNSLLTAGKGGVLYARSGIYNVDGLMLTTSNGFSNVTIKGDGPSTLFQSNAKLTGTGGLTSGMLGIRGVSSASRIQKLTYRDFAMQGVDAGDCVTPITIDQADDLTLLNLWFTNFGIECVRGFSGTDIDKALIDGCHAKNTGNARGASVFNLNAKSTKMVNSTFEGCANAMETQSFYTQINNCEFKDMVSYCLIIMGNWSGFLVGGVEQDALGAELSGNIYVNGARGINIPDYTGHSGLKGNLGQITISNETFDRMGLCVWGGSDAFGSINLFDNMFSGQRDAGGGPTEVCVAPQAGTWRISRNTWRIGKGIQWSNIVGAQVTAPKADRQWIDDNVVENAVCNSVMFNVYQDTAISRTKFLDMDGTISANGNQVMYRWKEPATNAVIAELKNNEWAWWDQDHRLSLRYEPSKLPTLGDTLPATWSFKPGDTLVSRGSTLWRTKYCTVGGTLNPTPLSITGTATIGTTTMTTSSGMPGLLYGWITCAVTGVTPKQVLAVTGTTLTLNAPWEANVPGGTALTWATPQFISDRDIASLTIPGMTAGDSFYAQDSTTIARLPRGVDGTTWTEVGGFPQWIDSFPRYDAGNVTGAGKTITRTPSRQQQKLTMTASGTVTIDNTQIPQGGYLILDSFQNGTGGFVRTWAVVSGTLTWMNGGVAPVLPTAANAGDRVAISNPDGTGLIGVLLHTTTGGSGAGASVTSVFTRTGNVVAVSGDYTVGQVTGAAPLASPALTGVPTAPTATAGTNTTQLATTAFVTTAVSATAPVTSVFTRTGAVVAASGDYAVAQVTGAAPLASPTFTGVPAAPTAAAATSTTQLATTAFVTTADNLKANLASPTFTGTPAAPTAASGTNTTQLATTAFVLTAASPAYVTLTDAATVIWATAGIPIANAVVTLGGNRTLSITTPVNGQCGTLIVKQDGTGSRTLTLPAGSKVRDSGGGAITLSIAANAIDILSYVYDGTNYFWTYGKTYS